MCQLHSNDIQILIYFSPELELFVFHFFKCLAEVRLGLKANDAAEEKQILHGQPLNIPPSNSFACCFWHLHSDIINCLNSDIREVNLAL